MSQEPLRLPIGISDFRALRRGGFHFVDKTSFIEAVLGRSAQVILAPRPRRFGKTVNLSMLRYFLEKSAEDRTDLFAGLEVASSEASRAHFQRYPVIFVSFKDVKSTTWAKCLAGIAEVVARAYEEHKYLLDGADISARDADAFTAILKGEAAETTYAWALEMLSRLLAAHHGENVVILIDEYDTPIHAGFTHRYYDQAISFFRTFLSGGLKDNPHLFKGVLTGILRVAKESIFSGLNNIAVYGILRPELAPYFGFSEAEVAELCRLAGMERFLPDLRSWYDGYLFGGHVIYNPWSVLSFLDSDDKVLRPYWMSTSSNDIVRELLVGSPEGARGELESLLSGGIIDKRLEEEVALRDVTARSEALWSFLLFSGYLKATEAYYDGTTFRVKLATPNREVSTELANMVRSWMEAAAGGSDEVQRLLGALLRGDARTVEKSLSRMVKVNLSYFDTGGPEPERVYQAFVVGLLASLGPGYDVRSNRESGFGRCDVLVLPKAPGKPGVVLELKTVDVEEGETPEAALMSALAQIRDRDYAAELRERGAAPIHEIAAAFDGKRSYVKIC